MLIWLSNMYITMQIVSKKYLYIYWKPEAFIYELLDYFEEMFPLLLIVVSG